MASYRPQQESALVWQIRATSLWALLATAGLIVLLAREAIRHDPLGTHRTADFRRAMHEISPHGAQTINERLSAQAVLWHLCDDAVKAIRLGMQEMGDQREREQGRAILQRLHEATR